MFYEFEIASQLFHEKLDKNHLDRHDIMKKTNEMKSKFGRIKSMFLTAIGLEILCFTSAGVGESIGLLFFGYSTFGITMGYLCGFGLAGFLTLITIIGRTAKSGTSGSCCLGHDTAKGLIDALKLTVGDFVQGIRVVLGKRDMRQWRVTLINSIRILITAESCCIVTAETIDLIFYRYSQMISIPLGIIAGATSILAINLLKNYHSKKKNSS